MELSYSAISRLIYHTFSERTIGKAIVILLQLGFIKRVQEKKNDNPSYILCTQVVQQALMQHAQQQCSQASEHLTPASNFAAPASNFATNNIVSNRVNNRSDKTTKFAESSVAFAIPITEDPISVTTPVEPPQTTPRPTMMQRPNTPRPAKQPPEPSPVQISPEGEMVFQRWCAVFGNSPLPRTATIMENCEKLVPYNLTEDDFRSIINYMRENDHKGYYKKRGIKLWDILPEYPGWASIHRLVMAEPVSQISYRKNLSDIVREARKKFA